MPPDPLATGVRPDRLIAVLGAYTAAGKTWVTANLASKLLEENVKVSVRKPVQSYAACDVETDADVLARATGEDAEQICPRGRWYPMAMAPPMAAAFLGKPRFTVTEIAAEIEWPEHTDIGLVETVGGPRSPVASDGDSVDLAAAIEPDLCILVCRAQLGAINASRLAADCIRARNLDVLIFLNRYHREDIDERNLRWLERDGYTVATTIEALGEGAVSRRDGGRR